MRTLEELRSAVSTRGSMRRSVSAAQILDLIAHVQQQAEQLATLTRDVDSLDKEGHLPCSLTARVEALESAGKVQTPAKLDEAPLGVGAKVLIPGEVDEVDGSMIRVKFAAIGYDVTVWVFPEHVRSEPAAPPPPAAPAPASDEVEQLRVQLAGCGVAAMGGIGSRCQVASRGDYGWSQSYQDVVDLRIKYEKLLAETGAAPAPASDDYEARARRYLADLLSVPAELEPFEGDVLKLATLLRAVADEATAKAAEKARREERAAGEAVCRKVAEECRPHSQIKTHAATVCADRIAARGKGDRTDG